MTTDLMFRNERLTTNELYVDRDRHYIPESRHPFFTAAPDKRQTNRYLLWLYLLVLWSVVMMITAQITGTITDTTSLLYSVFVAALALIALWIV